MHSFLITRQGVSRALLAGAACLLPCLAPAVAAPAPAGSLVVPAFAGSADLPEDHGPFGSIILAQSTGEQQSNPDSGLSGGNKGGPSGKRFTYLNPRDTDRISDALGGALKTCGPEFIERRYRIDCIRFYFRQVASELPQTGEYAPVRAALARAADQLDAIVRQNQDTAAPSVRPRQNGKPAAPRLPPIRAIRADAEARAARQAEAVIAEAATALLRSTENSERRMTHFQQIAAAIDSTKVLLRSA